MSLCTGTWVSMHVWVRAHGWPGCQADVVSLSSTPSNRGIGENREEGGLVLGDICGASWSFEVPKLVKERGSRYTVCPVRQKEIPTAVGRCPRLLLFSFRYKGFSPPSSLLHGCAPREKWKCEVSLVRSFRRSRSSPTPNRGGPKDFFLFSVLHLLRLLLGRGRKGGTRGPPALLPGPSRSKVSGPVGPTTGGA